MKLLTVYKSIQKLGVPIFRTDEIAIKLGVSNKYGYELLRQLSEQGLIVHLKRGLWGLSDQLDPLMVPDYLTSPLPSYVSLQSALYHHGIISQIPSIIYAVSLARTRSYTTPIGVYSIHHISPELFLGFDNIGESSIQMACPEKALFDFFYFKAAKSKLFYALPEVEIPKTFEWDKLQHYATKISNKSRQVMVLSLINKFSRKS